jgi:hypothetical protein
VISRQILRLGVGVLVAHLAFGCGEPVADIDRTQPNKIKKAAFDGEWYYRQTVVDINGTATSSFVALEGDGERVKFQVTENMLIARRAHEDVLGVDAPAYNVPQQFFDAYADYNADDDKGSPVAAFGIQSHFDVQRAYNASTGEQSNVIMENMMDSPWFERQWMRVSWTQNMIGAMTSGVIPYEKMEASITPQDQGLEEQDVTWFIECHRKGSMEEVSCDAPDAEVTYIDTVTEFIATPRWPDCFTNFFSIPGIFNADCGTERIWVRSSFAKIRDMETCDLAEGCDRTFTLQNDFVPREYDDYADKKFGFFRMNRAAYDRRFGTRDTNNVHYAHVRALWQQYTRKTAEGALEEIPYHERDLKPIPYYVNVDHPYDLLDEMGQISDDYDIAFRRIIFALHNHSAEEAGLSKPFATLDDVPRMFYICSNPGPDDIEAGEVAPLPELEAFYAQSNEAYKRGACVRGGQPKRMGDVRYSFFNFINGPNLEGPLGYGPSSADPLTGELVNGTSNAYGAAIDSYAQYLLDMINIVNGDLEPRDVGYGKNVEAYFDALRAQQASDGVSVGVSTQALKISEQQRVSLGAAQVSLERARVSKAREQILRKLEQPEIKQLLSAGEEPLRLKSAFQSNPLASLKGTAIEQKIIFPELVKGLSMNVLQDAGDLDEVTLERVSPVRDLSPAALRSKLKEVELHNIKKRIHFANEGFDPKFLGWAREGRQIRDNLRNAGVEEQEVQFELWKWVRGKAYIGLQEHEVGHSLGLRHNFAASTDSLNYFPEYWAIRQKSFKPDCKTEVEGGQAKGKGYRTFDPFGLPTRQTAPGRCEVVDEATGQEAEVSPTDEEHAESFREIMEAGLETYGNASIMEYGSTFGLNDQAGLALFDYAALAYGYGGLLEVFNSPPNKIEVMHTYDQENNFTAGGSYMRRSPQLVTDMRDVDDFQITNSANQIEYDEDRADDRETYQNFNGFRDNGWTYWHYSVIPAMFYDESQKKSAEELRAQMQLSKRVSFEGIGDMWRLYDRSLVPEAQVKSENLVEVPYKYCEDIFANGSTVDCRRWDTGADDYEVLKTYVDRYKSYYPLESFRRGRLTWGLDMYPLIMRTMGRYFDLMLKHYQYWLINASSRGVGWYQSDYGGLSASIAAQEAINTLASVFTIPSVGTYLYSEREGVYMNVDSEGLGVGGAGLSREALQDFDQEKSFCLSVANDARYQFDQFVESQSGDNQGERPFYFPFMLGVKSHFWDKYIAMMVLTDGSVDVLGQDSASNNQSFFIPPMLVFADELYRLFSGLITENVKQNIGVCVEVDANGEVVKTNTGCPDTCSAGCAVNWKPMELVRGTASAACPPEGTTRFAVVNPYTSAYGNGDFNMRYLGAVFAASAFQGNMNYDWIDTAGLYVKGRADTPALNPELAGSYEEWEFTDTVGVSNGLTYVAYCPPDYTTNQDGATPRPGCDMILSMRQKADRLQLRRIEEALKLGRLNQRDVGDDPLNPDDPERVERVLEREFPARGFAEFFDLEQQQEMARFHNELLRHFFFVR